MARDRHHVDRAVRRGAESGGGDDGVLEGGFRHDVGRPKVLAHHADDAPAGLVGHPAALAIRCGDGCAAGQGHAQYLCQRVHRRRRAHRVAMADRRRRRGHHLHELVVADLAFCEEFAALPYDSAGAGQAPPPPAVQHRPAGQHDRRDVHGRRGHQTGRRGLVAARGQYHPVDRIAVQHLDQGQICQITIERRGRSFARLLDWVDRKFQRYTAGGTDAVTHAARQLDVMAVAWR